MTMQVQVVSPERILWSGDAELVTARTVEGGDITFLTGHAPFVGALETGKVTVRPEGDDDVFFAVHGGFVEVSNDRVKILSDQGVLAEEVDPNVVRGQRTEAEAALARVQDELERKKAEDDLKWHAAQLRAAGAE